MPDAPLDSQRYWDRYAASDPLWAVLAFPDKSGGRWELQEFMKTGEREVALLYHRIDELQLTRPGRRALDFGCGVGRLTQALARRQERVVGADISRGMVDLARRLNQYGDRVEYLCTAEAGLDTLPARAFDCIYSNIVLQHVVPELSVGYLEQFFRLLAPGGLLIFQLPSHQESPADAEIKAMPDDAYKASIELSAAVPARVAASETLALTFKVRNDSGHSWRQPDVGPLAVGNHWYDATGERMVVQDDGRAPLLQVVTPGLEWPVLITMRAPAEPGTYVGEVDLVHEGISWFAHKGSRPLRFTIVVAGGKAAEAPEKSAMIEELPIPRYPAHVIPTPPSGASTAPARASFPMHGVRRDEVMAIIRGHKGRLAYLEEDRRAGPEWVSYRYFVVAGR
jgi:SAM-dependent methyltransferase